MINNVSLETLTLLGEHQDFMESLSVMADMGAGAGKDSLWWVTQSVNDEQGELHPLNIKVHAFDTFTDPNRIAHKNILWHSKDFSNTGMPVNSLDLIWSNNSFQCSNNPLATLSHWWELLKEDGMLCLIIPYNLQLTSFRQQPRINTTIDAGAYFNYSPGNIIALLASSGFDCRGGHFKFVHGDKWMRAAVYKTLHKPQRCINWYELIENKLLPYSVEKAILSKGKFDDTDIVVEWVDHSVYNLGLS